MDENYYSEQWCEARAEYIFSPDSIEVMLEQAFACLEKNCFGEAAAIYEEILKAQPDNIYAAFNLGLIKRINGELPEAISCFSSVLELDPYNFEVLSKLADAYRDQGWWDQAAATYRRALKQEPAYIDGHYSLGLVNYQRGELTEAVENYRKTVELDDGHADAHYNLGVVHFEKGDYTEAAGCYERALSARPDDIDTHYNLAVTRTRQGRFEEAAAHYLKVVEVEPGDASIHNSLGVVYRQLKDLEKAEACYRKAIELRPDYGSAYTNLAVVLHLGGKIEEAVECYAKAIELGHQPEAADYMLAALTGSERDTAPRDYVRSLFDSYADNFEHSLVHELGYNSPALLREMAGKLTSSGRRFGKAVDLGCGTGLVGECVRDITDHLIGIDLSARMLDKAGEKDVYDELHCGDVLEFLDEGDTGFDLVVAADVLIYLGALEPFFEAVKNCLAPSGHLLLTVEKHDGPGPWHLRASGRYAYTGEYIEKMAERYGFSIEECSEVDLRKEKDEWLRGCLFVLRNN